MNSLTATNGNSQSQTQQQGQTQGQQPNQFKELQEIVQGTLEKQGILAKAQAQLRKHVFEALCFTEQQNKKFENVSPKIDDNNVNDRFAMALIRDFLSYHQLDYTLSLMNTESQKKLEKTQDITRNEIASRLGLGAQKPNPSCSLLHLVVEKLFDVDVLKPRNSTLDDSVKLRPRASNDSYRSTLDSLDISKDTIEFQQKRSSPKFQSKSPPTQKTQNTQKFIPKQPALNAESDDAKDNNDNDRIRNDSDLNNFVTSPLDNLTLKMAVSNNLPPISSNTASAAQVDDGIKRFIEEEPEVDISILSDTTKETNDNDEDKINIDDALDELLDSSSNNGDDQEADDEEEEELRRIEQMNKTMEQLRQQTSEFEKLKKESISPSIGTEYDDEDFGTDEDINSNIESVITKDTLNINNDEDDIEIEEDIDEDIEIDEEEIESQPLSNDNDDEISNTDNIYSAKDDKLAEDVKLENVADIIMDVQTQKIDFKL